MSDNKPYRTAGRRMMLCLAVVAALAATPLKALDPTQKIELTGIELTVGSIFKSIEGQTGYSFAFNKSTFDTSRRVDIPVGRSELGDVLNAVLRGTGFSYIINNNHIIILPAQDKTAGTGVRSAQNPSPRAAAQPQRQQPAPPAGQFGAVGPAPAVAVAQPASRAELPVVKAEQGYVEVIDNSVYVVIPGTQVVELAGIESLRYMTTPDQSLTVAERVPVVPQSPRLAVKTNLLLDATTTMNLGLELRISPKWTAELTGYYNPWSWKDNRKFKSIAVQPEFRYWLCDPFAGHFLGVHAHWAHYNFGNLPLGNMKRYRYQGDLYGAGVSYGYSWWLGKRWALEGTIGVGYAYLDYEQFDCGLCGAEHGRRQKLYVGITKLGVNLSFLIK